MTPLRLRIQVTCYGPEWVQMDYGPESDCLQNGAHNLLFQVRSLGSWGKVINPLRSLPLWPVNIDSHKKHEMKAYMVMTPVLQSIQLVHHNPSKVGSTS